ncbi:hypothetical protein JW921_06255 [Candidatus Fermentibacterales bacterium]|nr:hypothetical protein [Candidatus Fermentibacterales bacterium]
MSGGAWLALVIVVVALGGLFAFTRTLFWKRLLLRRATEHAAAGRIGRMIGLLERNRDRGSVSDPLTNALIFFNIRAGQLERARELVEEAMARGDASAAAEAQLGFIAGAGGDSGAAEGHYRKALSMDPELRGTLNVNLAALLIERGEKLDEAEALLREALESRTGPARSGVHLNLALLHLAREEGREALVQSLTGYELLPGIEPTRETRSHALALASKAYELLGDAEEAGKMARRAVKLAEGLPGEAALRAQLKALLAPE